MTEQIIEWIDERRPNDQSNDERRLNDLNRIDERPIDQMNN